MESEMSCCGGNCGCASDCKCGSSCTGCKMYPDLSERTMVACQTMILGMAPQMGGFDVARCEKTMAGAENGDCKCGENCTCNPCTCK